MEPIKLKVCGITRACDAEACGELGVDYCGFVFHPQSPRYIAPEAAGAIRTIPLRVGVFTSHDADEILRTVATARLDYVQLHAGQSDEVARRIGPERVIRVFLPGMKRDAFAVETAFELYDAGYGTGKVCDWTALPETGRYFAAGGLTPANIPELLKIRRPFGLDVNSGVESAPGVKDRNLIRQVKELV